MSDELVSKPLAEDVPVRIDARRIDAQWSRISARLESQPRLRWPVFAVVPALVVAAVLFVLVGRWRGSSALPGPESTLALDDGSTLAFGAGTTLALREASPTRTTLQLTAGSVVCDVTHVEGRTFVVRAGDHDVTVLGTRFSVTLAKGGHELEVRVERGRVRVAGPSGEHVLVAGQSFSTSVGEGTTALVPAPSAVAPPSAVASASAAPVESVPTVITIPSAPRPAESPKEIFAKAMEARTKGQSHEAAALLDVLRKKHRTDGRAGLAAFELGRLRLDTLNDPAGAAEAFADAVVLAPGGPFREDAEARRVEALDRAHDARCTKAKAAYLERFPTGLHVKAVSARCGN